MGKRIADLFRRDVVLCVSFLLAAVSCAVSPPSAAYLGYIDFDTLITLFCLMLIVAGLGRQNFLRYIAGKLLAGARSARGLVLILVLLCFVSSMFITNDVALLTFVPLGMMLLRMAGMESGMCMAVTLMTVAANLGSMATPIGNPQNLYLFGLSGFTIPQFMALTGPYAALSAALLLACVLLGCGRAPLSLRAEELPPLDRGAVGFYLVLFLLCVAAVAGLVPHPVLLLLVSAALLWRDRSLFLQVDYSLILTFIFFFLFVGNMNQLDSLREWISGALAGREKLFSVLLSQVISNVPAAMLLSGYTGDIPALIVGTNLGGLGTLIASMASLISYKQIANQYPAKKGRYLLVFTLVNLGFLVVLYWL